MDDRARFVLEAELSDLPFAKLCRRHHISRPTGYKWLERFRVDGMSGLHDRAHRTRSCPHATPPAVVDRILNLPERRGWGARKLARIVETARPFPERVVGPDYPGHFEVRRVSQIGSMRWRNQWVCVSHLLGGEYVGLEEVGDGVWATFYGPVQLGWLDERDFRIMDVRGQRRRR
jgi:hypothetical protein